MENGFPILLVRSLMISSAVNAECLQLSQLMLFPDGVRNLFDHGIKLGSSVDGVALGMRLLEEPQLLKSNDRVALGEFEIELRTQRISTFLFDPQAVYSYNIF